MSTTTAHQRLPKLIAFDLDGTIWSPDMYQLWGGGSPFTVSGDGTKKLLDRNGTPVKLLGISSQILQTLKTEEKWKDTITAWVSCTDEPDWAAECMKLFNVNGLSK
jgi:magnesium-dependent phosphatase 1